MPSNNKPSILITGGTGLVGTELCKKFAERGYRVACLLRSKTKIPGIISYSWDLGKGEIDREAIETADYIIHLAGANIGEKRWTAERKKLILDSRIKTAELIFAKCQEVKHNVKAFISASAVGYYGAITSERVFAEVDPPSNDFLGEVCRKWEESADNFKKLNIRSVQIRSGVVLTKRGGILSKLKIPVQMGIGSALGSGNQYLPWIHIDDLCGIYVKAVEDVHMQGAYNAVAPEHVTNKGIVEVLARVLKKPLWLPNVPTFILKLAFGEMSDILLKGSKASANKIIDDGYVFVYPDLKNALINLLRKDCIE